MHDFSPQDCLRIMKASQAFSLTNACSEISKHGPEPTRYYEEEGVTSLKPGSEPSALRVWCVDDTRLHIWMVQMGGRQTHAFRARFRQL